MTTIRTATVAALLLALAFGSSPSAGAESLKDARAKVRKALVQAKQEVSADSRAVKTADSRLDKSRAKLNAAKSELAYVKEKLAAARARDAVVAGNLQSAQNAFDLASTAVVKAQADVERQRTFVGIAVRTAYQRHADVQGMGLLFGTDSASELAQRVQWSDTIFDTSTAQLDRLNRLQAGLEKARAAKADAEAELIKKKDASAEQVSSVKKLTEEAAARKAELASLVAKDAKARAEAEDELEKSRAQYKALERQEARIAAKIRGDSYKRVNKGGFIKPVNARAGSPFGMRYHPILHYWRMHWGTDFGASCGAPIRAMANGKVVSAGWTSSGFGNYTLISYGRVGGAQIVSGYAHQSRVAVRAGERVKQGEIVGYVGTTGLSTGCHLHLQIYRNGARVNPMRYL